MTMIFTIDFKHNNTRTELFKTDSAAEADRVYNILQRTLPKITSVDFSQAVVEINKHETYTENLHATMFRGR